MKRSTRATIGVGLTLLAACTLADAQPPPAPPTWELTAVTDKGERVVELVDYPVG